MNSILSVNRKRNSLPLALLASFGVCVAWAVVWAIFYEIGIFASIVASFAVFIALIVFDRFYKINWIFYLWAGVWVILLNILAMLVADSIYIASSLNISFFSAFSVLCDLIGSNTDVLSAFISNCVWTVVFTLCGVIWTFLLVKKEKKAALTALNNGQVEAQPNPKEAQKDRKAKPSKIKEAKAKKTKETKSSKGSKQGNLITETQNARKEATTEAQNEAKGGKSLLSSALHAATPSPEEEKFALALSQLKSILDEFALDPSKDKEKFKKNIALFINTHLKSLNEQEKQTFKGKIASVKGDEAASSQDKKAVAVMEKLI